jgi:hypothetical protein
LNTIFINFSLFLLIIFGNGFFFSKRFLKNNHKINFYEILLLGLVFTVFLSQLINFFLPLNNFVTSTNILIVFFYLMLNKLQLKDIIFDYKIFVLFLILVLTQIYGSDFSDDLANYHYGIISNADKINLIWGISFLHDVYGTLPIWLITHSYLNFEVSLLQDIHILNGLILFIFLGLFFTEIKNNHQNNHSSKIILFGIFVFILIKFTRLKEFGIDRPVVLLFCSLIYYYLKYFILISNENIRNNFIIVSLISILIITIKITYLPVLIFPIFLLIYYKKYLFVFEKKYFLIFLALLIFILKNFLSTGCIVYPIQFSCFEFIGWSNLKGAGDLALIAEYFNKSWNLYEGTLTKSDYISNFNWIETWFNRGSTEILELLATTLLAFIITLCTFGFKKIKNDSKLELVPLIKVLMFIILGSLIIYFAKNPSIRMNFHVLISFLVILLIYFTNLNFESKYKKRVYFFLILIISFNFYKNINRIYSDNFINDPIKMISKKIYNPNKHILNEFVYYTGWYGNSPIGNTILVNKKYEKKLIFQIISKK